MIAKLFCCVSIFNIQMQKILQIIINAMKKIMILITLAVILLHLSTS